MDIEGEASEDHQSKVNTTRKARAASYLRDPRNLEELAILTLVLDVADSHLLYPMMGDGKVGGQTPSVTCKLDMMLDPDTTLIGNCGQQFLNMIDKWVVDDDSKETWSILKLFFVDVRDETTARYARSQVLRMWSSFSRREEFKYADWPYPLR